MSVAVTLALLAACAFALGSVLQQKGTLEAPASDEDTRFLVDILRRPVWLAGGGMQLAGWVLQAAALDRGSLVVVQAVTSLSLVIALPLGAWITDQDITHASGWAPGPWLQESWSSCPVISPGRGFVGLGESVVVCGDHRNGRHRNTGRPGSALSWSAASFATRLGRRRVLRAPGLCHQGIRPAHRQWAIVFACQLDYLRFDRVGPGRIVLQQSALRTGVLAPAVASCNAATLFGSILFGTLVYDEAISDGGARLAPALIGLGMALVGITLLAGAEPPVREQTAPG